MMQIYRNAIVIVWYFCLFLLFICFSYFEQAFSGLQSSGFDLY